MPMKVLVVGRGGFLGSTLAKLLPCSGLSVTSVGRELIDLSLPNLSTFDQFLKDGAYDFAVVCAAVTDVEKCHRDQERSHQINVIGTISLLESFKRLNITPIFFSSDYVFELGKAVHHENDRRNPSTCYGKQKLLVEEFIESRFDKYLIFRTSKLMSMTTHPKNILYAVIRNLLVGTATKCFTDQWINPVFVEDIAEIIKLSCLKNIGGVFHLGTRQVMSRYEIGRLLADLLGCNPDLIQPSSLQSLLVSEPRPTHNVLSCRKIELALNFRFKEMIDAGDHLKSQEYQSLNTKA